MRRWTRTALTVTGTLAGLLVAGPAQAWREGSWSPKFYPDTPPPPRVVEREGYGHAGGTDGRHRAHAGHVRHHHVAPGHQQWVWVPAAWHWNGHRWVLVPGHWAAAW